MELSDNISYNMCQCKNSIKLRILEIINNYDKPSIMHSLVENMFSKIKKENNHIDIDENFLKTYISGIISELINNKMINLHSFENKSKIFNTELVYIKLNTTIFDQVMEDLNKSSLTNKSFELKEENNALNNCLVKEPDDGSTSRDNINKMINEQKEKEDYKIMLIDKIVANKKILEKLKKENKTKQLHEAMHKYNEIKDVGQELLGHIASHRNKRIKDLYEDMNISDDEKND